MVIGGKRSCFLTTLLNCLFLKLDGLMAHLIVIRSSQFLPIIIEAIDWKKIILGRALSGWNQIRIGPILTKVKHFCFRYDFQY